MLYFFLKSIVINFGIIICRIIQFKNTLNRSRNPGISLAKKKDDNLRNKYKAIFISFGFYQSFIEVNRKIFVPVPLELIVPQATRNNIDLEILERFTIRNPPPRRKRPSAAN